MDKKIWAIHFNDLHIKNGNENVIYQAIKYMVDYAVNNNISNIICGGDVFDSRSFQRLSHLKCWERCLDLFKINNITCWCNTGNHDKSLYNSEDNFIEPFKHHPSIRLFSRIKNVNINGKKVTISPFFEDKILEKQLKSIEGAEVLIGHWSCDGSTYLGKTDQNKVINKKLLSKWNKVFLSHYHNYHEVTDNIIHLPSLLQDNFGEDNKKGFSIIYDDLSYEIIKGNFKEFKKVLIDLNEFSIQGVKELIETEQSEDKIVRFEFTGEESKLKSLDKTIFQGTGIDVKLKFDKNYNFDNSDFKMPTVIEHYGEEDIQKEFKFFCNKKGYDFRFGKKLLDKFFKNK